MTSSVRGRSRNTTRTLEPAFFLQQCWDFSLWAIPGRLHRHDSSPTVTAAEPSLLHGTGTILHNCTHLLVVVGAAFPAVEHSCSGRETEI